MTWIRPVLRILCLLFIVSVIVLHECEARGARGGGRFGGRFGGRSSYRSSYRSSRSYSSSYRSGSRLSRSFRSSSLRRGTSPYTRSNWKYYAGIGMIYGSTRYMRTRRYRDHPDEMPTVCSNRYEYSPNGSVWGFFICPRDGDSEDKDYCCGSDNREYCCHFGDDPGRVAGIVIGVLIAVAILGTCVYCCCKRHSGRDGVVLKSSQKTNSNAHAGVRYQVAAPPPPQPMTGAGYDTGTHKDGLPYNPTPGYPPEPTGGYGPPPSAPEYPLPGAPGYPPPSDPGYPPPSAPGYPPPGVGYPPAPDGKEPLPMGDVSNNGPNGFVAPYPPPEGGPQGPAPPGFVYPPPPNGPGPYPSQPPPPYMQ